MIRCPLPNRSESSHPAAKVLIKNVLKKYPNDKPRYVLCSTRAFPPGAIDHGPKSIALRLTRRNWPETNKPKDMS